MDLPDLTLKGVAETAGYLVLGAAGTALLAVGLLRLVEPLRPVVYDAFYLAVGPWSATVASSVLSFAFAGLTAVGAVAVLGVALRDGTDLAARVVAGVAGLVVALVALLAVASFLGVGGLPAALVAVVAFAAAVPVGLRRAGAWSRGVAAFAGGLPVLALLVLLLGFGLGWGGGYDLVAREVPAGEANGSAATFDGYPDLRDDLLSPDGGDDTYAYCEEGERRTCRLPLRGYEGEARAARFLAEHGVRCPFRGARSPPAGERSVVVADGDTYYRVRCQAYGD